MATLAHVSRPAAPGDVGVTRTASGCRLDAAGGPPCPCQSTPARIRLLLELPLPLNSTNESELEAIPGIGPVRAAAIASEREVGGPFASVGALQRVRGLGPVMAERLGEFLFVGEADPACSGGWWAPPPP